MPLPGLFVLPRMRLPAQSQIDYMKFFRQNPTGPTRRAKGETGTPRLALGEAGQTMIETLAALFILVMGVSAAAGLAIYAFNSSSLILEQIVATGLAREGIEAVRNMRDSNWLAESVSVNGCFDFVDGASKANCYTHWLNKKFCIDPMVTSCGDAAAGTSVSYFLGFDPISLDFWTLSQDASKYGLLFDPSNSLSKGFYSPNAGLACDNSAGLAGYCRKIILTKINSAPYDQDAGPLLKVQSMVWWVDKKCPPAADFNLARSACRLEMDTYLTNWKNY